MAVTYGFYNSYNGDRKYDANDFDQLFDGIISDGVFATIGDGLAVIAGTGMQVVVKSGKAWFNRTWTLNDAQFPLTIAAADTLLNRIDAVVLEVDTRNQTRANSIKIVQGTASANAQKPNLVNSGGLYQHPLAYVTINKNAASITNANIESNIGKSGCEYVTGVLETISIDDLFQKWQGEFDAWFGNVKAQLSGSVAENLQRQITQNADDIKKKADTSRVEALETWKGELDAPFRQLTANAMQYKQVLGDINWSGNTSVGANDKNIFTKNLDLWPTVNIALCFTYTGTVSGTITMNESGRLRIYCWGMVHDSYITSSERNGVSINGPKTGSWSMTLEYGTSDYRFYKTILVDIQGQKSKDTFGVLAIKSKYGERSSGYPDDIRIKKVELTGSTFVVGI